MKRKYELKERGISKPARQLFTPNYWIKVIAVLYNFPYISIAELARQSNVTYTHVRYIIRLLQQFGLVSITQKGREQHVKPTKELSQELLHSARLICDFAMVAQKKYEAIM